jgi:hypothetical protein
LRIVVEDLRISTPIQGGVELALSLLLGEVLVQNVSKKFQRDCSV